MPQSNSETCIVRDAEEGRGKDRLIELQDSNLSRFVLCAIKHSGVDLPLISCCN